MPLSHSELLTELERSHQETVTALATSEHRLAQTLTQRDQWRFEAERLEEELVGARERIRQLEAAQPAPGPEPARILLGVCPGKAGGVPAAVTKWPQARIVRVFDPGEFTHFQRPTNGAAVHFSFKPSTHVTDAQCVDYGRSFRDGDYITVWHELDVKAKTGAHSPTTTARYLSIQNDFCQRWRRLRGERQVPDVAVVCVVSGWRFRGDPTDTPHPYLCAADVLGVDLDGANHTTSYYDWPTTLPHIRKVADEKYGGRWMVPEYAWGRVTTDTDGRKRADTIRAQMPKILAAHPEAVCYFDFENVPGENLTQPAEIAAWTEQLASAAR